MYCCFYNIIYVLLLEIQLSRGDDYDLINRLNPSTLFSNILISSREFSVHLYRISLNQCVLCLLWYYVCKYVRGVGVDRKVGCDNI